MIKNLKKSSAGKRGDSVRSDCYIELNIQDKGGIKINLQSKVDTMYGEVYQKTDYRNVQLF